MIGSKKGICIPILAASLWLCVATTAQAQVQATLQDFFLAGTQPSTLVDPMLSAKNECISCHGNYNPQWAPYETWKGSAMAQSARDPMFHAAMAVAEQDVEFAGDLCIRCHAPVGWLDGRSTPTDGSALTGTDFEGVTCHLCHRMVDPIYHPTNPPEDVAILNPANLGGMIPTQPHNGTYIVDPNDLRRGPFDLGAFFYHSWAQSPFHQDALLCATCHDVSNPLFTRMGGSTPAAGDTYALNTLATQHPTQSKYDMFPIERTWSEWSQSAFAVGGVDMLGRFGGNKRRMETCQDCHMPDLTGEGCALGPPVRPDLPSHTFAGANSWLAQAVLNLDQTNDLYGPGEESCLTQPEVDAAIALNVDMLQRAADMKLMVGFDELTVRVTNQTGHKLPTGYPEGRRMWINVKFYNRPGQIVQEHGFYNFATATLTSGDTKVYEAKLGLDAAMSAVSGVPVGPSFHFALNNVVYQDNRIPPRGFTNAGFAAVQAAPIGATFADGQFWDDTIYDIPCNAVSATVTLYYQTTSREYVEFLENENTTNDRGTIAFDQWLATGMSAPVEMETATVDLPDCNGNGVLDACDIGLGNSEDDDGNLIPDECGPFRDNPSSAGAPGPIIIIPQAADLGSDLIVHARGLTPNQRAVLVDVTRLGASGISDCNGVEEILASGSILSSRRANRLGEASFRIRSRYGMPPILFQAVDPHTCGFSQVRRW